MSIGEIILELRKERAISQKQVAEDIGVSQSAIAKIEINRNEATASTIRKLADYFNVTTDYLLGIEDEFGTRAISSTPTIDAYSKEERQLVEEYRKLPDDSKKLVLRMVGVNTDAKGSTKKIQNN
jgi:transcriptional regulator with XRE-family HTH domain